MKFLIALMLAGAKPNCTDSAPVAEAGAQGAPHQCAFVEAANPALEWIAIDLPNNAWPGVVSLALDQVQAWAQTRKVILIGRGTRDQSLAQRCAELGMRENAVVLRGGWRRLISAKLAPVDERAFELSDAEASATAAAGAQYVSIDTQGELFDVGNDKLANALDVLAERKLPYLLVRTQAVRFTELPEAVFFVSQTSAPLPQKPSAMFGSDLAFKRPCFWR